MGNKHVEVDVLSKLEDVYLDLPEVVSWTKFWRDFDPGDDHQSAVAEKAEASGRSEAEIEGYAEEVRAKITELLDQVQVVEEESSVQLLDSRKVDILKAIEAYLRDGTFPEDEANIRSAEQLERVTNDLFTYLCGVLDFAEGCSKLVKPNFDSDTEEPYGLLAPNSVYIQRREEAWEEAQTSCDENVWVPDRKVFVDEVVPLLDELLRKAFSVTGYWRLLLEDTSVGEGTEDLDEMLERCRELSFDIQADVERLLTKYVEYIPTWEISELVYLHRWIAQARLDVELEKENEFLAKQELGLQRLSARVEGVKMVS